MYSISSFVACIPAFLLAPAGNASPMQSVYRGINKACVSRQISASHAAQIHMLAAISSNDRAQGGPYLTSPRPQHTQSRLFIEQ